MAKAQWQTVLNVITELASAKDQGLTLEDIHTHLILAYPDATRFSVFSGILEAINKYKAPIMKVADPGFRRGVRYYIPKDLQYAARALLDSDTPRRRDEVPAQDSRVGFENTGHYTTPGSPMLEAMSQGNIRIENCLHLIRAKAPRSLSCEDVADFFCISVEDAAGIMTATCKKYPPLVSITVHAKLK